MDARNPHLQELIAEQAAEWYVAHRHGGLSEAQHREFLQWLRTSPAHVAEYLSIADIARDVGDIARQSDIPLERLLAEAGTDDNNIVPFANTASRTADGEQADSQRPATAASGNTRRRSDRRRPFARLGALAATAAAAGAVLWVFAFYQPNHFATRHGEQRTLQLPDHSVVRLNSDSAIAIDFGEDRRNVLVKRGQVYFEVAEDGTRPFNVRAGNYLIEDIGTAFDVYLREDATATVTVVEGRVRIWDRDMPHVPHIPVDDGIDIELPAPEPLADLQAGSLVRLASAGPVQVREQVDVQQVTAWTRERIVFKTESIAEVAAEFNRYNRRQIQIDDPRVGAIPISGVFRTYDVQSFAEFLDALPGVRTQATGKKILVTAGS